MFLEGLSYLLFFLLLIVMLLRASQYFNWCDTWRIPGPPGNIFVGNMYDLGNTVEDFFNNMHRIWEKYGNYIRLWQGHRFVQIIISDPDCIRELLTSNVYLDKAPALVWQKPRNIISPPFHFNVLEQFFHVFNHCSNTFISILETKSVKGPINIWPLLQSYSLDVICETSMGKQINAQFEENNKYVKAIEDYMELLMLKYFSLFRNYKCYYCFTKDYKKEQEVIKILKDLTKEVIRSRKAMKANRGNPSDNEDIAITNRMALVDLLLDDNNKDALSDEELQDQLDTFLFAGHHTMSSAISFSLFQAAKNPEIQAKILEEIHQVLGTDKNVPININHVQQMKFLECFIKETLRIYTTIPFFERQLRENFKLGKYVLPKGTNVIIYAYGLHHDPRYYPEPEKFDPDRFLYENVAQRHSFAYIPFGAGSRNCIGERFAMHQLKTTIANVLRKIELSAVIPEHKIELSNVSVLKPSNGIIINAKVRTEIQNK